MKGLLRMNDLTLGIPNEVADVTEAYLIVVLEGRDDARLAVDVADVAEQLASAHAHDVYVLPPGQGAELLAARERAFWLVKAAGADDLIDMVVPRDKIPDYLAQVQEIADRHGARVYGCGHAGDGNIHFSVYQSDEVRRGALLRAIFEVGLGLGGAISGEHGIGRGQGGVLPGAGGSGEAGPPAQDQGGLRPDGNPQSGLHLRSALILRPGGSPHR